MRALRLSGKKPQKLASLAGHAILIGLTYCGATALAADGSPPRFVDRSGDQTFEHVYDGGWEHYVGGGVATFDCNGDLFPELYVAGGANPSKLLINETGEDGGALRFRHQSSEQTDLVSVIGAYPIDLDSDGITDLFVLRSGENIILKGEGDCRFHPANDSFRFDGSDRWSTAFSATFEEGEILPTLAIANYVNRDDPDGPFQACDDLKLYRPHSPGSTIYGPPLSLSPGYCALSVLFSDWGRKGQTDLRISNDRHYYVRNGSEQMLRLEDEPRFLGPDDGWIPLSIWGMGIASRDIDRDGLPEIFLTSMADQKLMLIEGDGDQPTYHSASYDRGTTAHMPYVGSEGRPSTGWHAAFGDVNNDGADDIFIAKGNVDQMPDAAMSDPNNLLMQKDDGTFTEAGDVSGLASPARGRGASLVDLNRDGKLDLVVVNRRANLELLENASPDTGNWISLRPVLDGTNSDAVGAWIELKTPSGTQWREVTVGGGHASGQLGHQHFGLGEEDRADYRIHWPDGVTSDWHAATINSSLSVRRNGNALIAAEQ